MKRFIIFSSWIWQFDSVKTHRDRLENLREGILEWGVQIFNFGKVKGPHKGFECCPIVAFRFSVASPMRLQKFSHFCSKLPFRVFTLESFFLSIFILFHFFLTILLCTWQFKVHPEQVKDWSSFLFFFVGWGKETTALLIREKISQERKLFSPNIHVQSKWTF